MYLLDTNICIYAIKGTYPKLNEKLLSIHPDLIKVSAVTVYELEYGAAKSKWGEKTRDVLYMFLSSFEIIPFTDKDAVTSGIIRANLESGGTPIGAYDNMIAAQGVSRNLIVVTHNTDEFKRVSTIQLEDWVMGMM